MFALVEVAVISFIYLTKAFRAHRVKLDWFCLPIFEPTSDTKYVFLPINFKMLKLTA